MPRQEQFLISGLPDVSDPSSRHSQQLGQSAEEVVPSDLMASEVLCNVDDDDNTVLHVEDVATERSHDVVECSQEEMVGGSVIISSSSRSERRRNLPKNNFNCIVMAIAKVLTIGGSACYELIYGSSMLPGDKAEETPRDSNGWFAK